ncbi:hypothetical protein JYT51_00770 [Candidatus Amoebophilus asiaticus]|nr:hypothetical protein [Candidatus Amoebophilus asiaticus]
MKAQSVLVIVGFVYLLYSCSVDDEIKPNTNSPKCTGINNTMISTWDTLELNDDYLIQFPETYIGPGRVKTFEGYSFSNYRDDNKVVLGASGTTYFLNYGDTLPNPIPDSISYQDGYGNTRYYNRIQIYCNENDTIGILYYSGNNGSSFRDAQGTFYARTCNNDCFRWALSIGYAFIEHQEVVTILSTIINK